MPIASERSHRTAVARSERSPAQVASKLTAVASVERAHAWSGWPLRVVGWFESWRRSRLSQPSPRHRNIKSFTESRRERGATRRSHVECSGRNQARCARWTSARTAVTRWADRARSVCTRTRGVQCVHSAHAGARQRVTTDCQQRWQMVPTVLADIANSVGVHHQHVGEWRQLVGKRCQRWRDAPTCWRGVPTCWRRVPTSLAASANAVGGVGQRRWRSVGGCCPR